MRLYLFAPHMAISTIIAVVCLYFPGHAEGLGFIGWYFYGQVVIALALVVAIPARQRVGGFAFALMASAWGFCCALVAGMSLGNSWL